MLPIPIFLNKNWNGNRNGIRGYTAELAIRFDQVIKYSSKSKEYLIRPPTLLLSFLTYSDQGKIP